MTKQDRAEARERLLEMLHPGDTVHVVLRGVSRSGMTRWIDLYVIRDGEPAWLSSLAGRAAGITFDRRRECLKVEGCGMDMGFHAVYTLAWSLWPEGYDCTGEECDSNDHSNPPRPPRIAGSMHHRDGGYALRHRWM